MRTAVRRRHPERSEIIRATISLVPAHTLRRSRTAGRRGVRVVSPGGRMSVSTRVLGVLLLCTCLSAQTRLGISGADWGTTVKGAKVAIYTLTGAGG